MHVQVEPPSGNGNGHGAPEGGELDWDCLLTESVAALRERAGQGHITAQVQLCKLALANGADTCRDHCTRDEFDEAINELAALYQAEFSGAFLRACTVLGIGGVQALVDDSLERVSRTVGKLILDGAEGEAIAA